MTAALAEAALVETKRLDLDAPGGRPLIRGLSLSLGRERVALIGRNGVGKSTLLSALAQGDDARVILRVTPRLVRQELDDRIDVADLRARFGDAFDREAATLGISLEAAGFSRGQLRKIHLLSAKLERPELLLLDEPTQDLDELGVRWLIEWVREYPGGLVAVSHDRRLLRAFRCFFMIAESGCRSFVGTFDELQQKLEREREDEQRKYLSKLNALEEEEQRNETIIRRRQRRKRLGRLRADARLPTRAQRDAAKNQAELGQARAARIREARIQAARELVRASRRALAVHLPLELVMPKLPPDDGAEVIVLESASAIAGGRTLFEGIDLRLLRNDRIGIVGPNGAGKTTLLRLMLGEGPGVGSVRSDRARIGWIDQGASNWRTTDSLLQVLSASSDAASPDELAKMLIAHQFPLALAERPLASLSPGERVRAALIALMRRSPPPEMLLLDEPTDSLDLLGASLLARGLGAWPGGLVVVSHDREFLASIGLQRMLCLTDAAPSSPPPCRRAKRTA